MSAPEGEEVCWPHRSPVLTAREGVSVPCFGAEKGTWAVLQEGSDPR